MQPLDRPTLAGTASIAPPPSPSRGERKVSRSGAGFPQVRPLPGLTRPEDRVPRPKLDLPQPLPAEFLLAPERQVDNHVPPITHIYPLPGLGRNPTLPRVVSVDGKPCLMDPTSGEVLGEVLGQRTAGPEGRPRKLRNFAAKPLEAEAEVEQSEFLKHGFSDRAKRRTQIEDRMRDVQGLLIGLGHMPEDAIGWRMLRELKPDELVPDVEERLRREWGWLTECYAGIGKCCGGAHGKHVLIQETSKGHHFSGLMHCDRSICQIDVAAKAAERREKLLAVINQIPEDAQLVLKVYGNRHRLGSLLATIEAQQRKALKGMFDHRHAREATYGRVVTLEMTHGKNGHHPHRNCLEAYRPGVDLEAQRVWEEAEYCSRVREEGGSADLALQEDWWAVVSRENLIKVINYIAKDEDGTKEGVVGEEVEDLLTDSISHEMTGGHRKRGKSTIPITDLRVPASAYAEAWCAKHLTWYSASGCFAEVKAEETEKPAKTEDEVAEEEALKRERLGITVAWLAAQMWKRLDQGSRDVLANIVYRKKFDPERFLTFFAERKILGGFGLGSPPEQDLAPPDE